MGRNCSSHAILLTYRLRVKLSFGTESTLGDEKTSMAYEVSLDAKMRELIVVAVAVSLRCDGCIAVHSAEAVKLGATREEIAEALGVAIALDAGATMVYLARVMDAIA